MSQVSRDTLYISITADPYVLKLLRPSLYSCRSIVQEEELKWYDAAHKAWMCSKLLKISDDICHVCFAFRGGNTAIWVLLQFTG